MRKKFTGAGNARARTAAFPVTAEESGFTL